MGGGRFSSWVWFLDLCLSDGGATPSGQAKPRSPKAFASSLWKSDPAQSVWAICPDTGGPFLRTAFPVLEALRITELVVPNAIVGDAISKREPR